MRKAIFSFFIVLAGAFFLTLSSTGCANIIPPSGGPRDSLPPTLVLATPGDSTLNFRNNRISFTFDEYVDLQEVQNNLLFTPTFETNPEVSVRLKTVSVRFRDSLLPNTTYVLNFGDAIRDINENNPLRNFTYVFSTGNALDSLTLSGRVLLAENGKTDSTLTILLHRNLEDSAVIKQRPVYIARVNSDGTFRFRNLPRDTFAIYALGDAGIMRRYQNKANQYFAFRDDPVVAGTPDSILLYAYREAATTPVAAAAPVGGKGAATPGTAERRLRFTAATNTVDLQGDFIINFPVPIRRYDSTQLSLSTDTTFTPVPFSSRLDSAGGELRIRSQWREGTRYNLILNREFAEDTAGRRLLKTDTLNFSTKRLSDYGRLNIRIRNLDTVRNPVLQFIQNSQVTFSAPIRSGVYTARLFSPGEYELRILYDANRNGKWDPGSFFGTKRQPEIVQPIRQNISVKADWDNEFERSL
ncbi:MAG: Ig-like domain-containing protein [Bacteroidota bacterium]|nr:Ig-like domain-containing protein [Bacteroidota bacterium]